VARTVPTTAGSTPRACRVSASAPASRAPPPGQRHLDVALDLGGGHLDQPGVAGLGAGAHVLLVQDDGAVDGDHHVVVDEPVRQGDRQHAAHPLACFSYLPV
jgi:hypothetical protein